MAAALALAFLLGSVAPLVGAAPQVVHLTAARSYRPGDAPWLHGLFFVANVALIEAAIVLGTAITAALWRTGTIVAAAAVGMLLAGLCGGALAIGGGFLGLTGDQRGGMAVVAFTLGGMGALMTAAVVRDLVSGRGRPVPLRGADRPSRR